MRYYNVDITFKKELNDTKDIVSNVNKKLAGYTFLGFNAILAGLSKKQGVLRIAINDSEVNDIDTVVDIVVSLLSQHLGVKLSTEVSEVPLVL